MLVLGLAILEVACCIWVKARCLEWLQHKGQQYLVYYRLQSSTLLHEIIYLNSVIFIVIVQHASRRDPLFGRIVKWAIFLVWVLSFRIPCSTTSNIQRSALSVQQHSALRIPYHFSLALPPCIACTGHCGLHIVCGLMLLCFDACLARSCGLHRFISL